MDARGFCDGPWWYEEAHGNERHGLRYIRRLDEVTSEYQTIEVYEAPRGRFLTLDGLMMLTSWDEYIYHEMLVHVPMCSVQKPRRVLIIGGGDCGCLREVLKHPVEQVVQCEIDPAMTEVCRRWFPWVEKSIEDPRVLLISDDGAAYVRDCNLFDVVLVDSTDPIGEGAKLFGREFYDNVRYQALAPGGIMAAQTESPAQHPEVFREIYGELRSVFPEARPYLGNVPSYPGGLWSWAVHRKDNVVNEIRGRYYSNDIHRAAFTLPTFVQDLLDK